MEDRPRRAMEGRPCRRLPPRPHRRLPTGGRSTLRGMGWQKAALLQQRPKPPWCHLILTFAGWSPLRSAAPLTANAFSS
eukprot:5982979-Alexandrium_andersonii.AAC.1